jgi:hypothetical protein
MPRKGAEGAESFQSVQIALSLCGLCASAWKYFSGCGYAAPGDLCGKNDRDVKTFF